MSNNLKWLRETSNISMRKLGEYTGISFGVIQKLECDVRPFRENHIKLLTEFFDVTSDFLLGNSDWGIKVFSLDSNEMVINKEQYGKIKNDIDVSVLKSFIKTSNQCEWYVFRSCSKNISPTPLTELLNIISNMSDDELKKTLDFIKTYIL